MNLDRYFKNNTVGGLLKNVGVTLGIILLIAVVYFYIYLPNVTNHGKSVEVPELMGLVKYGRPNSFSPSSVATPRLTGR